MIRILIVEDEAILRQGFRQLLDFSRLGCQICGEARNGKEGLALIRQLHPDIVFTDLKMPVMDGLEMLRQSKETEQYEAVILTGYGEFSYAQEAISLQVAEYLLKPFNRKELEAVLIKLTERVRKKREQSNPMIPESIQVLMEIPAGCSAYVQSAVEWIGVHYAQRVTDEILAETLGVSADYLNRLFRRETGWTLHRYLNRYRIAKACLRILWGSEKIYEIAEQVGFSDYKYFFQVFTRLTGVSPTQYKKVQLSSAKKDAEADR